MRITSSGFGEEVRCKEDDWLTHFSIALQPLEWSVDKASILNFTAEKKDLSICIRIFLSISHFICMCLI